MVLDSKSFKVYLYSKAIFLVSLEVRGCLSRRDTKEGE